MGSKLIVPSIVPQKKYFTYALRDGDVFYVGKGTGNRLQEHATEARRGCSCRKCRAIRSVWDRGEDVQAEILYETDVERDALIYEWALLNMVFAGPHLTNCIGNVYETERRRAREAARWERFQAKYAQETRERDARLYRVSPESQSVLLSIAEQDGITPLEALERLIKSCSAQEASA